jgi:hypothetical protein
MFAAELFSFIMQHTGEMVQHLQPFCCSGVWISIGAHALGVYFKLQKMARAVDHISPSLVMLLITFVMALIFIKINTAVICNSQVRHFSS